MRFNTVQRENLVPKRRDDFVKGPEASLGKRLRRARKKKDLQITQLAEITGISKSSLTRYESGERTPGATELRLLCDELAVSPQALIYGDDERDFGPLRESFLGREIKNDEQFTVIATMLIMALPRPDRAALMQLLYSLAMERIGEAQWADIEKILVEFSEPLKPEIEAIIEQKITDGELPDLE